MTEEERLRQVAREAAHEAVDETLQRLGFDTDDPDRVRRTILFADQMKERSDKIAGAVIWTFVSGITMGIMTLVYTVFKDKP